MPDQLRRDATAPPSSAETTPDNLLTALQRELDRLAERQRRSDDRVTALEAALTALRPSPGPADGPAPRPRPPASREDAMHRLRVYLGYFRDAGKVLDVGCGRGELVELLEDEGVPVWGVDENPDAADYCGARGLPVTRAEAAAYLDEQADGSLGGVFLGRAAGRTTPADLAALLRRCRVKLRRGGVLVVESVNPACPEAPAEVPGGPSRAWPLPLLRSLLEGEGFGPTEVVFSGPVSAGLPPVARGADEVPPRASAYHTYAVAGRS